MVDKNKSEEKYRYIDYQRKYDFKSLIGISYFGSIILLILWVIINEYYAIPENLIQIWLYLIFIPIILTVLSLIIIFINWFIYVILRIIWYHYENTICANIIENVLGCVFPKKLYSFWFGRSNVLEIKKRTIYYWIVLNIFVFSAIIIVFIFMKYPQINIKIINILKWLKIY